MANPIPSRITDEMWRFWLELKKLEPDSLLGGIYAYKPGYHNTRDGNSPGNYSVVDPEDRGGPSDKAAAVDWTFPDAQRNRYETIMVYSSRLLAAGRDRDDPRVEGLREFYGQADKDTQVEGWDFRYDRPAYTTDETHLWHIHFSFDRSKVEDWPTFEAVLSVLRGESLAAWQKRKEITAHPDHVHTGHPPGSRVLQLHSPRMEGEDVAFVQRWIGARKCGPADGIFGPRTRAGVCWYQRMRGITVDGIVGRVTWSHMGVHPQF